jgi:hypothetical protein
VTPVTETIEVGKTGYTTYQLKFVLSDDKVNCYTIFGNPGGNDMVIPAAFQVPAPFGANTGGTNPAFRSFAPDSQFDSWLTAGETAGDTAGAISSIGIDWDSWNEDSGLTVGDGAIFWMNPDDAPHVREIVVAQLTIPDTVTDWVAILNAQGRSTSGGGGGRGTAVDGGDGVGDDWTVYNIEFGMGGPTPSPPPHPVFG